MRSIMEAVLRDHYGAVGADLKEKIDSVDGRLPPGAGPSALHRLRTTANTILHLDRETSRGLQKWTDKQLEIEVVSLLFVLRALIEGAR
jgi:hypothetical protein